jgi:hypothetical protein
MHKCIRPTLVEAMKLLDCKQPGIRLIVKN